MTTATTPSTVVSIYENATYGWFTTRPVVKNWRYRQWDYTVADAYSVIDAGAGPETEALKAALEALPNPTYDELAAHDWRRLGCPRCGCCTEMRRTDLEIHQTELTDTVNEETEHEYWAYEMGSSYVGTFDEVEGWDCGHCELSVIGLVSFQLREFSRLVHWWAQFDERCSIEEGTDLGEVWSQMGPVIKKWGPRLSIEVIVEEPVTELAVGDVVATRDGVFGELAEAGKSKLAGLHKLIWTGGAVEFIADPNETREVQRKVGR